MPNISSTTPFTEIYQVTVESTFIFSNTAFVHVYSHDNKLQPWQHITPSKADKISMRILNYKKEYYKEMSKKKYQSMT